MQGLKLGVPREYFIAGMDAEVEQAVRAGIETLRKLVDVSRYAVATYYILANAEASSNLARYDGVRYGVRTTQATNLLDMYMRTRAEGLAPK